MLAAMIDCSSASDCFGFGFYYFVWDFKLKLLDRIDLKLMPFFSAVENELIIYLSCLSSTDFALARRCFFYISYSIFTS